MFSGLVISEEEQKAKVGLTIRKNAKKDIKKKALLFIILILLDYRYYRLFSIFFVEERHHCITELSMPF